MRKLKFIAAAVGLLVIALLAVTVLQQTRRTKLAVSGATSVASGDRAPASAPAPQGPAVCSNFHSAICSKRGITRDPTGIVDSDVRGELQALRLYEDIIRQHPDWSSDQVDEELARQIYTPKRRARLEGAFRWVEYRMQRMIDRQPDHVFNAAEKKAIKDRIGRVVLELPPPASNYADEPDLFTKTDVFYERISDGQKDLVLRLRVGGAFLFTVKSWFNLVFTLAHEIAHAIDPCEIRHANLSFPAYDRLSACFMQQGFVRMPNGRNECGENDQLSEAFADWVAVEITSEALAQYGTEFDSNQLLSAAKNSVRDLCEQDSSLDELDMTNHPSPQIRIERIFGDNPRIRRVLGCAPAPSPAQYCGFDYTL